MRPIDADKLIKKNVEDMRNHADFMTVVILSTFNEMLVNEPVIKVSDAEPVRHGAWKHIVGMNSKCSECGHYFPVKEFEDRPFDINYCPNCGAKMDGGDSS